MHPHPHHLATAALGIIATLALFQAQAQAQTGLDLSGLPPPVDRPVDYAQDIRPIFERSCFRCHGPERPRSGLRLDNRADALEGGDEDIAFIPGNSQDSPLIHFAAHLVEDLEMPPLGKLDPLTPAEISLLRAWIDQGAAYSADAETAAGPPANTFELTPRVGYIIVDGDSGSFRQHHWRQEGLQGGFEHFLWEEQIDENQRLEIEGHALRDDYLANLELRHDEGGFLRAGFRRYSSFYDDNGGFFPGNPELDFDRDLELEFTKVWAEVGSDDPGRPMWVVGYEYHQKRGTKSISQWLPNVVSPGTLRRLNPSTKDIDESRHVIRFGISHDVGGTFLEDNFRYERYDLDTQHSSSTPFLMTGPMSPGLPVSASESHHHHRITNTVRAERKIGELLFLSGGYLYTRTEGEGSLNLNTPVVAPPPPGVFWSGQDLILSNSAHVMNLNARIGPVKDLTFIAGLQNEWSHQEGTGNVLLNEGNPAMAPLVPVPAVLDSNQNTFKTEEHMGLRYAGIPFTVLNFTTRLRQESVGLYEEQNGGPAAFLRDTDTKRDRADMRAAIRVSPWRQVSVDASYNHRSSDSDYTHNRDIRVNPPPGPPGPTYSAFILGQELITDETAVRLVLRPVDWLRTTLQYRMTTTDYEIETQAAVGTTFLAGVSEADTTSIGIVLTPWQKLSLSGNLSHSETRTEAQDNNNPSTVPVDGKVQSALAYAGYTLSPATLLSASYSYSRGDYPQNNFTGGLPLGVDYDQHTATIGINRSFKEDRIRLGLQYAFFAYSDASQQSQDDYTAHGLFTTFSMQWPGE